MKQQEILAKVKVNLRISHNVLDDDLNDTIGACLADLELCGIRIPEVDELILNAIKLYCRANYTDDTVKAAAYLERYNTMKASFTMSENYRDVLTENYFHE